MKQLSALDAFFLHGETPKQAMNLSGIGIYNPATRSAPIDLQAVLAYGAERTRRSALFRRRLRHPPLGSDQPYWAEDADFDIREHVFHSVLPAPGGRAELDTEIARIHALPVERGKALWQWWFIEGLETVANVPSGCFALLFKLHHAAFDGMSAWQVINVSHDIEPDRYEEVLDEGALPPTAHDPAAPLSIEDMGLRAYQRALSYPFRLADTFIKTMPIFEKLAREDVKDFPLYAGRVPSTPFNAPLTIARCHRKVALRLSDIKRIRALVPGATVNDVVLTIIAGGLRRYLGDKALLPDRSLVVGVPISIRRPDALGEAGNQAVLSVLPLGTDIADPVARLAAIHAATGRKKEYVEAIPAHVLTDYMEFVPGISMNMAVRAFTASGAAHVMPVACNLIVTNVPASRVPIYFAGAEMIEYDACGPLWDGAGLLHVVTSYLDTVNISFDAVADLLPDPDRYVETLHAAITALLGGETADHD